MWLVFGIVGGALAAEPVQFELRGPQSVKTGQVVYTAGDNVRVRRGPSTNTPVIATARLGSALTVRAGKPVQDTIGDRASVWLPVEISGKSGHVWAGALTRARIMADLDNDGEEEIVTAAYNTKGEVVVRVYEPAVADSTRVSFVKFGPFEDAGGLMERAALSVSTASETGIPLAKVEILAGEFCGSGSSFRYVSHRTPAKATAGTTHLALEHQGSGGDAPVWWSTEVTFEPSKKQVTIRSEMGEEDVTVESSGRSLVLKDGVFVDRP